ncbi:MAG: hypothetical protein ACE5NM_12020, partial [Sedimentisphaerales bacterium]
RQKACLIVLCLTPYKCFLLGRKNRGKYSTSEVKNHTPSVPYLYQNRRLQFKQNLPIFKKSTFKNSTEMIDFFTLLTRYKAANLIDN